jgi:fumarate reductase subunit D
MLVKGGRQLFIYYYIIITLTLTLKRIDHPIKSLNFLWKIVRIIIYFVH